MRKVIIFLFILFTLSITFATQEVVGPRVRVLYSSPEMAEYAQQVAFEAERTLDVLVDLFDFQPRRVTFILQENTDIYNARELSLPHLKILIRPLFPTESHLGLRAQSNLYHIIIHELTHAVQTTYTLKESSEEVVKAKESGFLRPGGVASLPPAWFLEGIAVWVESTKTEGGRNGDALTTGILETLALDEDKPFPTLTEVGLATYSSWPGGDARYLLGGSFVEYLANKHGFEAILDTLQTYNRGGLIGGFLKDFSTAWQKSQGSSLNDQWLAWQEELKVNAQTREESSYEGEIVKGSGNWLTRAPVVSPKGTRLAWISWPHIVVANIYKDEEGKVKLKELKRVISERVPNKLDWLNEDTLVYTRFIAGVKGDFSELFSVDVSTGREKQLTPSGTRILSATVTPEGCVLLVHDIAFNSSLKKWCQGTLATIWQAPKEAHILSSAVNSQGQIALSIWQRGFTDIALLNIVTGELNYLSQDAAQDLEPTWASDHTLIFRSDRHTDKGEKGAFDLYKFDIYTNTLTRLTRSLGGTFQPNASTWGIWHSAMTSKGSTISLLENPLSEEVNFEHTNFPPAITKQEFPVHRYNPLPSLVPYAVVPSHLKFEMDEPNLSSIDFSIGATLLAEDITEKHRYSVNAGYTNFYSGHLDGIFGYAKYTYTSQPSFLGAFRGPRLGLQLGLWPHKIHRISFKETALGAKGTLEFSIPLDKWVAYSRLSAGLLHLDSVNEFKFDGRASFLLSQQRRDNWGHGTRGLRFIAHGILSATPVEPSYGAWGIVSYYQSLRPIKLPGTLELYAQGGYKPSQPIPLPSPNSDFNGFASLGYRYTQPVQWRYGDGLYALERINFTPRVRSWLDNDIHVGADLSVGLDTIINYMGAVSVSGTFGYAEGFWYRFGLGLSF